MKHIKTYENNKLKIGDYVIIKTDSIRFSERYNNFLSNHIGKVTNIEDNHFYVNFKINNKINMSHGFDFNHVFNITDLKYYSKSLDELEQKIDVDKYNL